ncbi:hypothetical protein [Streptomyces sp. IB2014 011-1]|uniref:hypothetical protein n=1 Tax=Streptomyces sp. IB2014 011-1 TaxID=1844478 RepID=UPI000978F3EA|nr:hypothetical protein [Streptomyces sp. IB2014 011-1]ONI48527.1 hypothetical protein STIB_73520 [Streptomyces sp. IB2014 011-1]
METTNTARAARGAVAVGAFVAAAAQAGSTLTSGDRAELGRAAVEAFTLATNDAADAEALAADEPAEILASVLADVYHHADGIRAPHALLGAALLELSTTVNMLPALRALGDDGRPGILACTIAALLAYGDDQGAPVHEVTDSAYDYWADEVEEERFMAVRAARYAQ